MEFVVSARKYRPATFRTVVGQGHVTQTLQSAIAKNTLAHAYLFTGPRGVGKTTCARIFAKTINCLQPTAEHEACGTCESCVAFDEGRSWGIHELDAASNNSVDDIRALIEKVRIPPQIGKYSVYIIDEVHMLSSAAFNAFLKTLEEPPAYAIFILATTERHKILPTILSRCQSYDFRRIGVKDIVEYLAYVAGSEGVKYDDESLNIIAQKADGGLRDALSTFDRVVSYSGGELTLQKTAESVGALDFNTYFEAVDSALAGDYMGLLMSYDRTLREGFDGQTFISGLAEHLRNLIVAKNPQTEVLLEVTGTLRQRYVAQAASVEVSWLLAAVGLVSGADAGYRTAVNRRLHVELALMKFAGLKKNSSSEGGVIGVAGSGSEEYAVEEAVALPSKASFSVTPPPAATPVPAPIVAAPAAPPAAAEPAAVPQNITTPPAPATSNAVVAGSDPHASQSAVPQSAPAVASQVSTAPEPAVAEAPVPQNSAPVAPPTPKPAAPQQPRVIRITPSISGSVVSAAQDEAGAAPEIEHDELSPAQAGISLEAGWDRVVEFWNKMQRPRLATALTSRRISGKTVTIMVANDTLSEEILQNKIELEQSIFELLGVRCDMQTEILQTRQEYRPVSLEQKYEYLAAKNPVLTILRDTFELSL